MLMGRETDRKISNLQETYAPPAFQLMTSKPRKCQGQQSREENCPISELLWPLFISKTFEWKGDNLPLISWPPWHSPYLAICEVSDWWETRREATRRIVSSNGRQAGRIQVWSCECDESQAASSWVKRVSLWASAVASSSGHCTCRVSIQRGEEPIVTAGSQGKKMCSRRWSPGQGRRYVPTTWTRAELTQSTGLGLTLEVSSQSQASSWRCLGGWRYSQGHQHYVSPVSESRLASKQA